MVVKALGQEREDEHAAAKVKQKVAKNLLEEATSLKLNFGGS